MSGESGVNRHSEDSIDRISELPDEVRECIIGHLPITDAVRTSVLKKKWRHSWKTADQVNLYFDEALEMDMTEDMYYRMVGRVLLAHVGPVRKIVFRPIWYEMEGDVHVWLELLSRKGVNDLTITCEDRIEWFDLPASLYYCVGLSSLNLGRCKLVYSFSFRGFPNLVRLELFEVGTYDFILEKIVSSCPLEILILRSCNFNYHKTAICAPKLKMFSVTCCYFGLDYTYLKDTPNLREASFKLEMDEDIDDLKSNCFDAFRSIPKIEMLTFDCRLHQTSTDDIVPEKLSESLENLRNVTFYSVDAISIDKMSLVFCMIRSTPNLQNLDIHMTSRYRNDRSKKSLEAAMAFLDNVCKEGIESRLKTLSVTAEFFEDDHIEAETALVSCIISCSPTLAELHIKNCPIREGSAEMQFCKTLSSYVHHANRRSSFPVTIKTECPLLEDSLELF